MSGRQPPGSATPGDPRGISWRVTPIALTKAFTSPDRAATKRAFDAMMSMKKIDVAKIEAAVRGG